MQIYSRVAAPKPLLTESQREKRLSWCIERQSWSVQQWKTVIWSDESRFTLFKNDGSSRVWQKNGTRYNIENLTPTVKHGGGGVMVWGCFSEKGLGPLVKVDGKMNRFDYIEILDKHLLPFIRSKHHRQRYAFQDDNTPVHTAKIGLHSKRLRFFQIGPPNPRTLILLNICGMNLNEDFENDLYAQRIFMNLKEHCKKSGKESHPKLTLI